MNSTSVSNFLPVYTLGGSRWRLQHLSACFPCERPGWNSWLLASAWSSPGLCAYGEGISLREISLSTCDFKWTNCSYWETGGKMWESFSSNLFFKIILSLKFKYFVYLKGRVAERRKVWDLLSAVWLPNTTTVGSEPSLIHEAGTPFRFSHKETQRPKRLSNLPLLSWRALAGSWIRSEEPGLELVPVL